MVGKKGMKWQRLESPDKIKSKKKLRRIAFDRWRNMHRRCYDNRHHGYLAYGGRGITVCPAWFSFEVYYKDTGDAPEGLTLDRADNNKGYCPENMRWATHLEQANNRREPVTKGKPRSDALSRVFVGEYEMPLPAVAIALGCKYHTLRNRLKEKRLRYGKTTFQLSELLQARGR